jgi:hypothetical protein
VREVMERRCLRGVQVGETVRERERRERRGI